MTSTCLMESKGRSMSADCRKHRTTTTMFFAAVVIPAKLERPMISASLPGELCHLGHAPPLPGMTQEFLAPRPYARYPPRAPRPRDTPPAPAFSQVPGGYRFIQHPASYPQFLYRPPAPAPVPPSNYPIRPRPTSGFVPPAPAPRSPPTPVAPIAAPEPSVSPERAAPPLYFRRGALIRLEDGSLRRVEDMRTEDFVASADKRSDLTLTHCTLLRMEERGEKFALTLAYDRNRSQVELESTMDHPFFVYGRGWASLSPDHTLQRYGLRVRKLTVGDVCVSMMERRANPPQPAYPTPNMHAVSHAQSVAPAPPQTYPENLSVKEDARKRRWSAPDVVDDDHPPAKKR